MPSHVGYLRAMTPDVESASQATWLASIVVPAHNEASRGFAVLPTLRLAVAQGCLVVVVCNGCTDSTVALASSVPGIHVVEIEVASKTRALNAGDDVAGDVFPRIYLDADVSIEFSSLISLSKALDGVNSLAAGPEVDFDASRSAPLVRLYFEALASVPFLRELVAHHLDGRGAYAVTSVGRSRFQRFPDIVADDTFFDRMFDESEKVVVPGAVSRPSVPLSLRDLLRAKRRTVHGAHEISNWFAQSNPERVRTSQLQSDPATPWWSRARFHLRDNGLLPSKSFHGVLVAGTYVAVEVTARVANWMAGVVGRTTKWR